MLKKIENILDHFSSYFFPVEREHLKELRPEDHFKLVEQARREWQDAKSVFDQVSDPDLIDHAVYAIDASERRYMYLLKKARDEGVNLQSPLSRSD